MASDSGRSLEMPLRVGSVSYALMNSVSGKGAGQQRVQVIEQKIAVVFAVPAQDHALAREIGRPRGRIVERRQIVPYG